MIVAHALCIRRRSGEMFSELSYVEEMHFLVNWRRGDPPKSATLGRRSEAALEPFEYNYSILRRHSNLLETAE
jgi:hypothetical protein